MGISGGVESLIAGECIATTTILPPVSLIPPLLLSYCSISSLNFSLVSSLASPSMHLISISTCLGFIGGYTAFGDSKGISGSVNNQLVLYLFSRSVTGLIQSAANRGLIPSNASTQSPTGFRVFAGITLALALYLTEYEPDTLGSGFMSTMKFLYHKVDHPAPFIGKDERSFAPIIGIITVSLLGYLGFESLSLENILNRFIG